MIIGIPKEVKNHEYRVGATPVLVRSLVEAGHTVLVEKGAGEKIGFHDPLYTAFGAKIVASAKEVYEAEMIVKVKEPQPSEIPLLKEGQVLFCFLHLAPDLELTTALLEKKVVGIAYETVTSEGGKLPLLIPMSEIAGRIAVLEGANFLEMHHGGKGVLLGGVPGVPPARVTVLGGGVVGTEAARGALGLGADVTLLDKDLHRLRVLDALFGPRLKTRFSTSEAIEEEVSHSDLFIGAVLLPGKTSPKLVTRSMVKKMSPGSVIVDVAIDQGGCVETSRPTSHADPTYFVDGVLHYCVTNMPGACSKTATLALTNATSSYVLMLADLGYKKALRSYPGLAEGLNVCLGSVTNSFVAHDLGFEYVPKEKFFSLSN